MATIERGFNKVSQDHLTDSQGVYHLIPYAHYFFLSKYQRVTAPNA